MVGENERVGISDGLAEGKRVGLSVGLAEGERVGRPDGITDCVGEPVPASSGSTKIWISAISRYV